MGLREYILLVFRRGWRDTSTFIREHLWVDFVVVVGAVIVTVLLVGGGFLALLPFAGLAITLVLVLLVNILLAPWRIITELAPSASKIHTIHPLALFSIEFTDHQFFQKESNSIQPYGAVPESENSILVIDATLMINTVRGVLVESIDLDLAGRTIPSNWSSERVYQQGIGFLIRFEVPRDIPRGARTAKIKAIVEGEVYEGEPFTLELPTPLLHNDEADLGKPEREPKEQRPKARHEPA